MARDLDTIVDALDTLQLIPGSGPLTLPDGVALFEAQFDRVGHDLVLSEQGAPVVTVPGFFLSPTPVDLVAANGAVLSGDLAARLAGSGLGAQYAQSGGATAPVAIGQVEVVSGVSTVQRVDGTIENLAVGVKIFQNDIISTTADGKVSVTFSDGTIFSLAQSSRMVIDNLVYDPDGSENSGGFSLLTGGFVFIAGQVAKTGDMDVTTPTATLGIRGTTVQVDIELVGGVATVNVALNRDPDGGLGRIEMTDLDGNLIGVITTTGSQWVISPIEGQTREVERITTDQASDAALLADALAAFQSATRRVDSGESFVDLGAPPETGPPDPVPPETPPAVPVPDVDGSDDPGEAPLLPPGVTPPAGGAGDTAPPPAPEAPEGPGDPVDESSAPAVLPLVADDIQVAGVEDLPGGVPVSGQLTVSQGDTGTLSFGLAAGPSNGTAAVNPDGTFTYVPAGDFSGTDTFTFEVSQGAGAPPAIGQVTVQIAAVNDAPVIQDRAFTIDEDAALVRTLTGTDADGDTIAFSIVAGQGPSNGSAVLLGNGAFSYVPDANFNGVETIAYSADDGDGGVSTGTVSVTVTAVNDAPVAPDSAATVAEDGSLTLDVLALASDVETASLTLDSVQGAGNGSVSLVGGEAVYTPDADFFGGDAFTYTVSDGDGGVSTGTVSVTVTAVNDAPVFASGAFPQLSVAEDGTLAAGFDLNGRSAFSDEFIYLGGSDAAVEGEWRWTGGAEAGQLFWQGGVTGSAPGGAFAPWDLPNEPNNGFGNEDYLMMYVSSGPVGQWNDISGGLNPAIGFLVEMDAEPAGLTGFVENPDNGHFYKFFENDVTWTEASVLAGDMGGYLATVTSADERAFVLDLADTITPYASDPEGDTLGFSLVGGGAGIYGTASVDASGNFQYVLNNAAANVQALTAADTVTEDFTLQVSDGNGGTGTGTISVAIDGAYDALAASDDLIIAQGTYYEGGYAGGYYLYGNYYLGAYEYASTVLDPFTVDVLGNDVGEGALSVDEYGYDPYDGAYGPGYFNTGATYYYYGTLSLNPDETLTYTPDAPFFGVDSFSYTAQDDNGVSGIVDATVVVVDSNALTLNVLEGFNPQFGSDQSSGNALLFGIEFTPANLTFEVGQGGAFGGVDTSSAPDISRFEGLYGTASVTSDGDWSYALYDDTSAAQAALALSGTGTVQEQFDLRITDLNGASDVTTLTASVLEGIDAGADAFVIEREPYYDGYGGYNYPYFVDIDILSNDSAGGTFTLTDFGTAAGGYHYTSDVLGAYGYTGTLEYDAVQETLSFKPMGGFFGIASFSYQIQDQFGFTSTGTVHIDVVEDQSDLLPAGTTAPSITIAGDVDGTGPAGRIAVSAEGFFAGTLTDLSLQLFADGEDGGAFADVLSLAGAGNIAGADPNFEIPLAAIGIPVSAFGATNHFMMTATYDVPDGGRIVEYKVSYASELSKAAAAQTVSGSSGPDLLFGSDFADSISGNDGADVIVGFFGADDIDGGAGDDALIYGGSSAVALNGGSGRDTLRLLFEDDGPVDLAGLNAQSIEAIDLTHDADQELTMTAADLIALFDGGDLDLNALLTAQHPTLSFVATDTITVLGGNGDTFGIDPTPGTADLVNTGLSVTTADANVLGVWQLSASGSSDILATLGIDADMSVTGQAAS